MPSVEAANEPVLTTPDFVMTIPLGLTSSTVPGALMVPAILPPPAPFKLFVLMAGMAEVRPLQFVLSIAIARGVRYLVLGALAVRYGDFVLELMRTRGRVVAIWVPVILVAAAVGWWLLRRISRARS